MRHELEADEDLSRLFPNFGLIPEKLKPFKCIIGTFLLDFMNSFIAHNSVSLSRVKLFRFGSFHCWKYMACTLAVKSHVANDCFLSVHTLLANSILSHSLHLTYLPCNRSEQSIFFAN